MWAILAPWAKSAMRPVTRSSKRAPAAMTRSACWMALLAATEPCMPTIHSERGEVSGKAPSPISVVQTGMSKPSARALMRGQEPEMTAPPPT